MTILQYRSSKDDDGCNDAASLSSMTNITEAASSREGDCSNTLDDMSYSDASLSYSVSSSIASSCGHDHQISSDDKNTLSYCSLTGRIVDTKVETIDDCSSVLSLDYSCSSMTLHDCDTGIVQPPVTTIRTKPPSSSPSHDIANQSPFSGLNLIGQRNLHHFRDECKKQQKQTQQQQEKSYQNDSKSNNHFPSIGLGSSPLHITRVLREGWLHKKGTGGDLMGREGWKKRYAYLVLVTNPHQEVEVPVLLIYRNTLVTMPSNMIPLDSAVIMTVGEELKLENDENNTIFDVVQAKKSKLIDQTEEKNGKNTRRSFAAPREGTDGWVQSLNLALIDFEKRRAKQKKCDSTKHILASTNNILQLWPNLELPEHAQ